MRTTRRHNRLPKRIFTVLLVLSCLMRARSASALELRSIVQAASSYHSSNARLEALYRAALLNTSREATFAPDGTAYVKTGDIPAEWLRDASAQVRPYSVFAKEDPDVANSAARDHRPRGASICKSIPTRTPSPSTIGSGKRNSSSIRSPTRSLSRGRIGRRPAIRFDFYYD